EHTVIDFKQRAESTIPVQFFVNSDPPKPESQKLALPETWDYNSFLLELRAWEGPPGTTQEMEIFRSRYLWKATVTIKGKTKLKTELGELPALRFDMHLVKLTRDGSKEKDSDERNLSLWISDDAGRVPLRVDTGTDYGAVVMEIV